MCIRSSKISILSFREQYIFNFKNLKKNICTQQANIIVIITDKVQQNRGQFLTVCRINIKY
uniref:Uncharacterized protein n=1 Tax=Amphimedon queenslandica TaxID=400682 RepID=A0A1X7V7U2_AMPQE